MKHYLSVREEKEKKTKNMLCTESL